MSEFLDRISKLSPQRLALLADELNERVQAAETEPQGSARDCRYGLPAPGKCPESRTILGTFA